MVYLQEDIVNKQIIVDYHIHQSRPDGTGEISLRPEMLSMDEYRQMTAAGLEALRDIKQGVLTLELTRRRGYRMFIDVNGSALVYITPQLAALARVYDEVTYATLAATAYMALKRLAFTHFPELVESQPLSRENAPQERHRELNRETSIA